MPILLKKLLTTTTFQQCLNQLYDADQDRNFLLAVSGGVDSMVMLWLFKTLDFKFEVAHVNYGLRDADSDADQKIVEEFCAKNEIPFHLYKVSEIDQKPRNSIQVWARNLRYNFFNDIKKKADLQYIVTAHNLDDQLETFIVNLSKASGLKGLTGIPANDNNILRPLLNFSKEEIYEFAKQNNIKFREDLSNQKNDYLRNFIRHEISSKLFETNDNFLPNFGKSISYLKQSSQFVGEQIQKIESKIIAEKAGLIFINKEKLNEESDFVKFEILRKFGFESETEIQKIFEAEKGKTFISSNYKLVIERGDLVLSHLENKEIQSTNDSIILKDIFPEHSVTIALNKFIPSDFKQDFLWEFDAAKISFPLTLRHKKEGDEFFPMGMEGRKKVAKFFKDEKIPTFAVSKIWLLCDGNNNVLGVIPFRQDLRYRATEATKIKITVQL